jgi:hypothetical protein
VNSPIEKELLVVLAQLADAVQAMPTANPKPNLLPGPPNFPATPTRLCCIICTKKATKKPGYFCKVVMSKTRSAIAGMFKRSGDVKLRPKQIRLPRRVNHHLR